MICHNCENITYQCLGIIGKFKPLKIVLLTSFELRKKDIFLKEKFVKLSMIRKHNDYFVMFKDGYLVG